jgi:hypothetical protein
MTISNSVLKAQSNSQYIGQALQEHLAIRLYMFVSLVQATAQSAAKRWGHSPTLLGFLGVLSTFCTLRFIALHPKTLTTCQYVSILAACKVSSCISRFHLQVKKKSSGCTPILLELQSSGLICCKRTILIPNSSYNCIASRDLNIVVLRSDTMMTQLPRLRSAAKPQPPPAVFRPIMNIILVLNTRACYHVSERAVIRPA